MWKPCWPGGRPRTLALTMTAPSGIWVSVILPTDSPTAVLNSPLAWGGGAPCASALPPLNTRSSRTTNVAACFICPPFATYHCESRATYSLPPRRQDTKCLGILVSWCLGGCVELLLIAVGLVLRPGASLAHSISKASQQHVDREIRESAAFKTESGLHGSVANMVY